MGVNVWKGMQTKYSGKPVVLLARYRQELCDFLNSTSKIDVCACLCQPFEMDDLLRLSERIGVIKPQNMLAVK